MPAEPPRYTRNWTDKCKATWAVHFPPMFAGKPVNILELGVYEGRSSLWFLDNLLTHPDARWYGIDPWEIGPMDPKKFPRENGIGERMIADVEARCREYLAPYGPKANIIKGRSQEVLQAPPWPADTRFGLAYIDGIHHFLEVVADCVLTWPWVSPGGVIIFDDLHQRRGDAWRVARGVDSFLKLMEGRYRWLYRGRKQGAIVIASKDVP